MSFAPKQVIFVRFQVPAISDLFILICPALNVKWYCLLFQHFNCNFRLQYYDCQHMSIGIFPQTHSIAPTTACSDRLCLYGSVIIMLHYHLKRSKIEIKEGNLIPTYMQSPRFNCAKSYHIVCSSGPEPSQGAPEPGPSRPEPSSSVPEPSRANSVLKQSRGE